jgi:AI-2 transport system permease protein
VRHCRRRGAEQRLQPAVGHAFALAIGALAGAFNGLLVVGLRIPAIVATLGTLGLYRGVMLLWTGGKWIEGCPPA